MAARSYGQYCGVTTAVELIGERWALLIVRDLLVGPRRYTDLKAGLPRIPTNILALRLKELQDAGVVRRVPLSVTAQTAIPVSMDIPAAGWVSEGGVKPVGNGAAAASRPGTLYTSEATATALRPAAAQVGQRR